MPITTSLALTSISTSSQILSSDHRNNYTAIQTAVNALIAAAPGYEYAYNEFTANVSVTATTSPTANTIVTASAVTFDGSTVVVVEFYAPRVTPGVTGDNVALTLWDGSTELGTIGMVSNSTGVSNAIGAPVRVARRLTPSAASHTYSVRAYHNAGTATVEAGAGGVAVFMPGLIRITKV